MSANLRKSAAAIILLFACQFAFAWQQQDAIARQIAREEQEFKTAENRWMRTPVDVRAQNDTIAPSDRQGRDLYWDELIGASMPLSQPGARAKGMPLVDPSPNAPEIGDLGDGVWLVGKFEGYRMFLTASQRAVYTEIDFRVQHVFGHPNLPSLGEGTLIQIDRPGGTIVAPWGKTISYEVRPEQHEFQPNHIYLTALAYHPHGNFYSGGSDTGKRWDVTDGFARPGNALLAQRAAQGRSEISGLSLPQVIQLVDEKFEEYHRKER
jgi:hypothetical protein